MVSARKPKTFPKKMTRRMDKEEDKDLPVIHGHQLTPYELKTFSVWMELGGYSKTARAMNVTPAVVSRMAKTEWWNELINTFVKKGQNELHRWLWSELDTLKKAITNVLKDGGDVRSANAKVKVLETKTKRS